MLVFGHRILFEDAPELTLPSSGHEPQALGTLSVRSAPLPKFSYFTSPIPHSLQRVRFGASVPIGEIDASSEVLMEVAGVVRLAWIPSESVILYEPGDAYRPERLRFWIFHTFLPLILRIGGRFQILHVGAVEIAGRAQIFMAPSFGGKSTLTDYFHRQGHPLLGDDTLGAMGKEDEAFLAVPSWPFHRPYRQAETLGGFTTNFRDLPLPFGTIFLLERAAPDAPIAFRRIEGVEKFRALRLGSFFRLAFLQEREFPLYGALARSLRVEAVSLPWERARIPEFYARLLERVHRG
jgi:hypothetical protein